MAEPSSVCLNWNQNMCKALRRSTAKSLILLACSLLTTALTACSTFSDVGDALSVEPALATDAPHVGPGGIDTSLVNKVPAAQGPVDYVGILANERKDISIPVSEINQNIDDLAQAGAARSAVSGTVTIEFNNDNLDFVVKQLLGGLLSANYVIPDDLNGTVSFKTEQPVSRTAIPSILRDILARDGYVMKLINGVYQIGRPETIRALENNAAAGAAGDYTSHVINLGRGNLQEVAAAVAQILPAGATITPITSSNSLVLRVSPADQKAIIDLIHALIDNSNADDLIAVVRLRESAPEKIAASIDAYFSSSGDAPVEVPLIVPLEDQQALLVVARNKQVMTKVRVMISGLDRENNSGPSLRIIPLRNLPAAGIAAQLGQIFSSQGTGPGLPEEETETEVPPMALNAVELETEDGAPQTPRATSSVGQSGKMGRPQPAPAAAPSPTSRSQAISIVPDDRNNALLVYATYNEFKRIRDVVEALDVPLAQVVIEATIVEVSLNDRLKYGVQAFLQAKGLSLRSSEFPDGRDPAEPGGSAMFEVNAIGGTTAKVVLEALQGVTDVRIISSPYLTVLDGRAARLSVGDQIPYLVQQTSANQTGETTTTNQIQVRDVGIILEVTPNIRADNSVVLNVQQEVSSARSTGAGETLTPVISQRAIRSDVVVNSGKTVLLGGLIQDRAEKTISSVPGLSKMPLLGGLFRQTSKTKDRTELLVMITPRVVRSSLQLDSITRMLRARATRPDDL